MAKMIFFILLAINVALFGMVKGLWGPQASELHEPNRLTAQINPDQLHIVSTLQPDLTNTPVSGMNPDPNAHTETAPAASPTSSATTATTAPSSAEASSPVAAAASNDPVVTPAVAIPAETLPEAVPPTVVPPVQPEIINKVAEPVSTPVMAKQPAKSADSKAPVNTAPVAETAKNNNLMCLEAGYFVLTDARKFETQINRIPLGMKEVRKSVEEVVSYMVRIPATNGQAGANRRAAELQKAGVHDFYIVPGTYAIDNLRWSVSLGVFRTENAAKAFMRDLTAKGIKQMVITPRKATSSKIAYQFKNVTPAQRTQIEKVMSNYSAQDLHHC